MSQWGRIPHIFYVRMNSDPEDEVLTQLTHGNPDITSTSSPHDCQQPPQPPQPPRRGGNIFQLFDTSEKPNHFVASRRRWLESQGRDGARQESGQNEWHGIEYRGAEAKAPPCSERTLQTPLPQQSSSSAREEEGRWVLMEDRRRRGTAFEQLAKEMLRYLDNSEKVKVGSLNCKNDWMYLYKSVFPFSKWPSRRDVKMTKRLSKYFGKKKRSMLRAGPDGMRSGKA